MMVKKLDIESGTLQHDRFWLNFSARCAAGLPFLTSCPPPETIVTSHAGPCAAVTRNVPLAHGTALRAHVCKGKIDGRTSCRCP